MLVAGMVVRATRPLVRMLDPLEWRKADLYVQYLRYLGPWLLVKEGLLTRCHEVDALRVGGERRRRPKPIKKRLGWSGHVLVNAAAGGLAESRQGARSKELPCRLRPLND